MRQYQHGQQTPEVNMNLKTLPRELAEFLIAVSIVLALAGTVVVAGNWDDFQAHCAAKYGADR